MSNHERNYSISFALRQAQGERDMQRTVRFTTLGTGAVIPASHQVRYKLQRKSSSKILDSPYQVRSRLIKPRMTVKVRELLMHYIAIRHKPWTNFLFLLKNEAGPLSLFCGFDPPQVSCFQVVKANPFFFLHQYP